MGRHLFADRNEAGRALGDALEGYRGSDVVVLALPRGGVPVGFEIAKHLTAPLDVIIVRKIGTPAREELAMGAVASGGVLVRNEHVIAAVGVDEATFAQLAEQKHREVSDRERLFRGEKEPISVRGNVVIVVDDGIATGSTITAALQALKQLKPSRIVVAVPVAPPEAVAAMGELADEVLCLETPTPFMAVGSWYRDFRQVPDDEVRRLLAVSGGHGTGR